MDIQILKSHLEEDGFRPEIDEDGDLVFKYEGASFFVSVDAEDPPFARVVFPRFWDIDNDAERARAVHAAHDTSMRIKGAKVFVLDDCVWASLELFLPDERAFAALLLRGLSTLRGAARLFAERMRTND